MVGVEPPSWSKIRSMNFIGPLPISGNDEERAFLEDARGWPMVSMVSFAESRYDEVARAEVLEAIQCGIELRGHSTPTPTVLPYRPILTGFVVDSLLFGAIAYAVLFACSDVWRWRRKQHGLCRNCGYELHGSSRGCPECGWQRESLVHRSRRRDSCA